ncbi:V-ATPase V1 sector subunit E [Malassezia japonica]|uniref:V-ATPase V1 sector subunit E n=1 Tax=Malassezia japonica TaxID=223818 RepID=A0AAF0EVU1_9BASI|nr:V-ATPase V1 sector subunit E [Malassezia japonica]WFD38028.1 V-ATPase V1 sector subunit E [Malassezia japonica]
MSHAMNDDEVNTELKKMVEFIRQEAQEKAREIQVKADEEFAIEKAKIVQQETHNLDAQFDKKKKQVEIEQKIAKSNQSNKARLEVLKLREESLQGLFESARERLTELTKDSKKYKALLEELLLQGLFDLHETSVEVIARSGDVQLVQEVSDSAIKRYTDETGRKANINVKEGLSKDSAGGLILTGLNGRIQLNNTLEERLHLLEDKMLPELRLDLFGPNKDRKFLS